ncbi:BLUF domain-containing protein [Roseicitreum antarcticum]|uniref:BLUF domain-containing protein n=1 Tax=Roseicitreum antarcticum TaxID=564137 RepID=UPI000B80E9D2
MRGFSVVYQLAYVSSSRTRLYEALLNDILTVSEKNNTRDGISGILMYHDQLFFQVLEGERTCVKNCYDRILLDPRHSAIGVPPLKWSTNWDSIIPFQEDQRWQESETTPKRSC